MILKKIIEFRFSKNCKYLIAKMENLCKQFFN